MFKPILLENRHLQDINPRVCGIHICGSGEINPPHHIERYVLHYVTIGKGIYQCSNREYAVSAGDIFLCRRGDCTCYRADWDDPFTYIWVSFTCNENFAALLDWELLAAPWAEPFFTRIPECEAAAVPEWAICEALYGFFGELAAKQPPQHRPGSDYVSRALNYIHANYPEMLRVANIAQDLGLSRNHFSRVFKAQTGMSPQEYLVHYRLEQAAKLLTREKISQKEAAHRVGYPDIYGFSRMFKRKYGVAPGEFVRQYREKE